MPSLAFAKLVATPTDTSWSQVYNAGNLFASLSLSKKTHEAEVSLNSIGKEMFSSLESEFFTLENKDLENIKMSLANSTHTIPSSVVASLCLAFFKENILYVFVFGRGTVIMNRQDKTGILIEELANDDEIKSASGFLENGDIIVLQTHQFAKDMPPDTISGALELNLPNDIAEALSPAMHEKDDGSPRSEAGGQAAIIIKYLGGVTSAIPASEPEAESDDPEAKEAVDDFVPAQIEEEPEIMQSATIHHAPNEEFAQGVSADDQIFQPEGELKKISSLPKIDISKLFSSGFLKKNPLKGLSHRSKLFLSVAVIILVILTLSISFTKQKEENTKTSALFATIYDPALEDYEDGISVKSINKEFARSDFLKSQALLHSGKGKFKKGSDEEKKILELLAKVDSELGGASASEVIKPKEVSLGTNDFLSIVKTNSTASGFAKDQNSTLFVTDKAVVSVSGNGTKKDIIENDEDWEKAVGISTYQGNMYVLDQENGVLKFTAGSNGFGKTPYFKTKPGNISTSRAIAIDGSVWILFRDGSIMKFTRGESDGFKVKALDKPLNNPTKLFTNTDTENLYVLDNGNSRMVKLSKDGDFQAQYNADILKSAKDFEVSEEDGKILILSGNKTWEIPL